MTRKWLLEAYERDPGTAFVRDYELKCSDGEVARLWPKVADVTSSVLPVTRWQQRRLEELVGTRLDFERHDYWVLVREIPD